MNNETSIPGINSTESDEDQSKFEPSPQLASYLISIICHLPQALDGNQKPEIEKAFYALCTAPDIQELSKLVIHRLDKLSPRQWDAFITRFLDQGVQLTRAALSETGGEDIFAGLSKRKQRSLYVSLLGWEGSTREYPMLLKTNWLEAYNKSASGEQIDNSLIQGLYTADLEHTNKLTQLLLLALGGDELMDSLSEAIAQIKTRLLSSPEWIVALCLMEINRGLATESVEFREAIKNLRRRRMAWLYKHQKLKLPGPHITYNQQTDWSEEASIAEETVYNVLIKKTINEPISVLSMAWNGKLSGYLYIAIKNSILDVIRELKSSKRNITLQDSLDDPIRYVGKIESTPGETPCSSEKYILDDIVDRESVADLLHGLKPVEKAVMQLTIDDYSGKMIAVRLGHTPSWVTKTKQKAANKIITNYYNKNGVARAFPNKTST
jgi:hypothetical protein